MTPRYSMVIKWSEADQAFLVELPELYGQGRYCTHGPTYEDAAKNGHEVLDRLIESYRNSGKPLPEPAIMKLSS